MKIAKKAGIFNKVAIQTPKRNLFDLSHERMFTCNMGELVPIMCEEVYPHEHWSVGGKTLTRTAPLARPMLSTVIIKKQHYFIANRILWPNWNLFISGGDKYVPDAPVPEPPYVIIPSGGFLVGSLADYLGFPTLLGGNTKVSAFPFAAYMRTYQEYFCDEDLMDTTLVMLSDGDNTSIFESSFGFNVLTSPPLHVCWEKDYFTAARPEPQKGPEVTIPLGTTADIVFNEFPMPTQDLYNQTTGLLSADGTLTSGGGQLELLDGTPTNIDISQTHHVDLSSATSATINDLRKSYALQRLYERLARGGSRITEFLRAVWGANPRNLELDRPDYFGGSREFLSISEVLQQSQTTNEGDDASPQGNMTGHGVSLMAGGSKDYDTNEYGIILSLFWCKPKTLYFQGLRRSWSQLDSRFDYYFPDLSHIGEQPVRNDEVFLAGAAVENEATFGYMPYGTHLRYIPDTVHGEFRSTQKDWTMVREFADPPALNEEFVSTANMTRRVFIDTSPDTDTIYVQHYNQVYAKRCLPVYGTPNP